MFDARAFNIPREEVVNYFLWRALDWQRNSIAMYCQAHFSAKQMHNVGRTVQLAMLNTIDKSWVNDLTRQQKYGTWIIDGQEKTIDPSYVDIASHINHLVDCDKEEAELCAQHPNKS